MKIAVGTILHMGTGTGTGMVIVIVVADPVIIIGTRAVAPEGTILGSKVMVVMEVAVGGIIIDTAGTPVSGEMPNVPVWVFRFGLVAVV